MNKEYYNKLINDFIQELIEKKDNYSSEIGEIATYIDFYLYKQDLSKYSINEINEKRNNMSVIYQLIEDLNKLIKKEN